MLAHAAAGFQCPRLASLPRRPRPPPRPRSSRSPPQLRRRSGFELRLNYCISLCNLGKTVEATEQYHEFVRALEAEAATDAEIMTDPDIVARRDALAKALNIL